MNLVPWKNKSGETPEGRLSSLTEFRSEVNRLFDSFVREPFETLSDSVASWGRWAPALDVSESDTAVTVRAEVPGVDPGELDITVTGDRLTIAGEKKETVEKKDRDTYHRESRYGSFSRTVQLPSSVDPQQVTAEHANGILTITLQKTPAATAKKIAVKSQDHNTA
ncbi:MAG TPA: Hsp20/alpha crystallin family protein [Pirellulales bacterium]|jgi:HSP20 family protein|nr:Hsp20/alpha crystallin family protein [Pirellulales bacterium]